MMQSVWLTKLAVSMLNRPDSVLRIYYQNLAASFGAEKSLICLLGPDGDFESFIFVTENNACTLPFPNTKADLKAMLASVADRQIKRCENALVLPLYCENTSVFGLLIFDDIHAGDDVSEAAKLDLAAFGVMIYSEAMGGIIRPHHDTVLSTRGLCVDYQIGQRVSHVVKGIDLDICEKEFTVMFGSSGCGKTSFLNAIGGMLIPTGGSVLWKGRDITVANDKELTMYRRNKIGFIFQRYHLISDLTARENVEIAAAIVKNPLSADEVLETVGLSEKANSYPSQMSGGEQQRVCIARALVKQSDILLCDEPTGALDTENARQVISVLQRLTKQRGIPVMMITHNPCFSALAGHCITMSNGRIVEEVYQPFPLDVENIVLR